MYNVYDIKYHFLKKLTLNTCLLRRQRNHIVQYTI